MFSLWRHWWTISLNSNHASVLILALGSLRYWLENIVSRTCAGSFLGIGSKSKSSVHKSTITNKYLFPLISLFQVTWIDQPCIYNSIWHIVFYINKYFLFCTIFVASCTLAPMPKHINSDIFMSKWNEETAGLGVFGLLSVSHAESRPALVFSPWFWRVLVLQNALRLLGDSLFGIAFLNICQESTASALFWLRCRFGVKGEMAPKWPMRSFPLQYSL